MYTRHTTPPTDVYASDDAWLLLLDLPGMSQDALSVTVERDTLIVSSREEDDAPPRWYRRLSLPRDADVEGIEATLTDGVLSVQVPRASARQIAIG